MALHGFEIEDHQALDCVKCDRISPLMVIAGPNGVGKSTLLHQLHQSIRRYDSRQRSTGPSEVECDEETESVYFSPHRVPGNNSNFNRGDLLDQRKTSFSDLLSDGVSLPNSPRNLPTQRDPRGPDATAFRGLGRRMAEFKEERLSLAIQTIDEGEKKVGKSDLPDVEGPLKELVDQAVPGISLEGVVEENNNYRLVFRNRNGEKVGLEDLSSGELDMIVMLFFVAELQIEANLAEYSGKFSSKSDKDMVVLIDGPEAYLHPYLQYQFIEFMSDYVRQYSNIQIILVTHSDIILNNTSDKNLWYLLYSDMIGDNQLKSTLDIDVDLLKEIIGEMGTSALAAGQPLLLVEGVSDREVLTRLYPELQDSMTILPMEGKKNILSIEKTLDKLASNFIENGIKFHAIVDRDQNKTEVNSSYIHKLPVTDIENILLQPKALIKAVNSLASERKLRKLGVETDSDIEVVLNDIISRDNVINNEIRLQINDELKFEVGMGASEKISEEAILNKFDEAVKTSRERIKNRYDSIQTEVEQASDENKMSEFSGKHILGEFSSEFDLQLDSLRLLTAEYIHEHGLHPNSISGIITDIEEDIEISIQD